MRAATHPLDLPDIGTFNLFLRASANAVNEIDEHIYQVISNFVLAVPAEAGQQRGAEMILVTAHLTGRFSSDPIAIRGHNAGCDLLKEGWGQIQLAQANKLGSGI